jgi:Kef-type K+ transport system membrane component KefB/mannitol/fructose-specific phosphotransferase system IIA component (Ntr-type)
VIGDPSPLLVLAVVILVGVFAGATAQRLRLPAVTGQILAGLAMGRAGVDLFAIHSLEGLEPLTSFALGLIAVTVGAHLNIRRLRNAGRRLVFVLLAEATVVPAVTFLALWLLGSVQPQTAALLATVAVATAPATIVALVKESRAKGVFVKTLVAAVALNNTACILLFEAFRAGEGALLNVGATAAAVVGSAISQILPALVIGGLIATAMSAVVRVALRPGMLATAAAAGLVLACGLASTLGVSPLLACLFLGFVQTNLTRTRDKLVDAVFADFEPVILTVFFTLAGMELTLEHAGRAGLVALLFVAARAVGKLVSGRISMWAAGAPKRVRENLGLALMPQAGVAVGLVILLQEDPAFSNIADFFTAVVLTGVVANEIMGPLLTRLALVRSGECGKERIRLIDFIEEEHVVTDFRAASKDEAIEKLVNLMLATHHLEEVDREDLLRSVRAREAEASTCLGGGLAVPHGILPPGTPMAGVMAISRDGLPFETPDGIPVHCMVLLGTAAEERERHLEVLATLARSAGGDPVFRDQLFNASNAAHVAELLHGEHSEDFNYFLEDPR